jgi:biopolymer transport protein ExbB/TolQ
MNILSLLQSTLYLIMNALLYPVIGLLIFLIIAVLFILGNFVSEYVFRRRLDADQDREELAARISREIMLADPETASQHIEKYLDQSETRGRLLRGFLRDFASQIPKGKAHLDIRAEKTLQQYEIVISGLLDKTRMMVRIGPMLGLMGTLIPMGPALLALSKGDLTQMANCLIIAFGTTVSGLAVGAAAYLISVVRERWYAQDMRDMEYIVDLVMGYIEDCTQVEDEEGEPKAAVLPLTRG